MPTFNDWCFDGSRTEGDKGIVRTPYGFHIMWFKGITQTTSLSKNSETIKATLAQEKFQSVIDEQKGNDRFKYTTHSFGVRLTDLG